MAHQGEIFNNQEPPLLNLKLFFPILEIFLNFSQTPEIFLKIYLALRFFLELFPIFHEFQNILRIYLKNFFEP